MKSKYFKIQELIPESTYEAYKAFPEDRLWNLFDPKLIKLLDEIKKLLEDKSIIINTWFDKDWENAYGIYRFRGYRYSGCNVGKLS